MLRVETCVVNSIGDCRTCFLFHSHIVMFSILVSCCMQINCLRRKIPSKCKPKHLFSHPISFPESRYPCPAAEQQGPQSGGKRSAMTGFLDLRFVLRMDSCYCAGQADHSIPEGLPEVLVARSAAGQW